MIRRIFILSALSISLLPSCTTIRSSQGTDGLAYRLPKGLVVVTAERRFVTPDDVKATQQAATDAAASVEADKKALSEAKTSLTTAQGQAAAADASIQSKLTEKIQIAKALLLYLTAKLNADQALSLAAKSRADAAAQSAGSLQESATVTVLPIVPDPAAEARFVASPHHLYTRDDNLKLTVTNGLLSTADVTSTDQTGNIIIALAQDIAAFAGAPSGPPGGLHAFSAPLPSAWDATCKPYSYVKVFDPTNKSEAILENLPDDSVFQLKISPNATGPSNDLSQQKGDDGHYDGLFYRAATSVVIAMDVVSSKTEKCGLKTLPSSQSAVAILPDSTKIYRLPTMAGAFTTTTLNFAFKDGMPTSYSSQRPSEALAFLSIPLDVAKAIISIPTQLLQLRVNYDTQSTAQINAQVEALKAKLQLLQAQQSLDAGSHATASP